MVQPRCRLVARAWARHAEVTGAMPLVSIILPTRHRPAVLPRALASVLTQSEGDFELLVVDNSCVSPVPLSAEVMPQLKDPRVRVLATGVAANAGAVRNVGLAAALGEWITFLDDDDAYHPDKISAQFECARVTGAPLVLCGARFHLQGRTRVQHVQGSDVTGDELLTCAGLGTPFLFHRRCGVRFDESLFAGEDHHYAQQLLHAFALGSVPVVPRPLVEVFQNVPASGRTNLRAEANWRAARLVWWEFGARYSARARRLFVVRSLVARAKLRGEARTVIGLLPALLRAGGRSQMRFAVNAVAVAAGWRRGRWVT